jgi:hypothetical protein
MESEPNETTSHEDSVDREVRKLVREVEERERIGRPMAELLWMLNSDLDLSD